MTLSKTTDVLVALWVAAWVTIAVLVARQVLVLRDLSDTVVKAGIAVRSSGTALGSLRGVPLVGPQVRVVADQAREAGRSAVVSGKKTKKSVDTLAILLGLGVGSSATVPALVIYLPLRLRRYHPRRRG